MQTLLFHFVKPLDDRGVEYPKASTARGTNLLVHIWPATSSNRLLTQEN